MNRKIPRFKMDPLKRKPYEVQLPDGECVFIVPTDMPRRSPGSRAKRNFHNRNQGRCHYCGRKVAFDPIRYDKEPFCATIDHKIPRSRGGSNKSDNKVTACRDCNQKKGNKTVEEYRLTFSKNYRFWGERPEADKKRKLPPR